VLHVPPILSLHQPNNVWWNTNFLEINAEKTKYMIMSRHPNSGQNQNIRTANESFENVEKFKYFGTMLTNQNDIHDEIKSRLNSGNACYHSVQNLLSSRLTSKNLKFQI
jgi:archaellum component FlaC